MRHWLFLFLLIFITKTEAKDVNLLAPLLSDQELAYLENTKSLTVCNVAQAASSDASYDLVKLLLENTNINLKATPASSWNVSFNNLQEKECDILPWATMVPRRLSIMNFTRPYARIKRVVITKKNKPYIRDLSEVEDEIFASLKGNNILYQIKEQYPKVRMVDTAEPSDVLKLVAKEKVFGGFASLYSVANLFDREEFSDLKIAGILPPNYDDVVSLATRKEDHLLIEMLEKAIVISDKRAIENFMSRGAVTTMKPSLNYEEYWFPILIVIFLALALVWWNRNLTDLNKKLEFAHSELESKTKELELLSATDTLTQTYNRIKLDQVFGKEIDRAERYDNPLSIIMTDVDYFKNVNDSHGHLVGDKVLKKFAVLLKENLRGNDILGRWGGEEFLIICPSTNLNEAEFVAEKLRLIIEKSDFAPVDKMTASFGVTQWIKEDTQESLISRADYAMYLSKNHGRNRVSISTDKII